jgi:hypothetical protein
MKETKSQKLSNLFKPTKEVDIDDIDDEYLLENKKQEEIKQPKKKRKTKEKLPIRSGVDLEIKGYEGKSVPRSELFEEREDLDIFDEQEMKEVKRVQREIEEYKEYKESKQEEEDEDNEQAIEDHLKDINKPNFLENIQNERRKEKQKAKSVYNQKVIFFFSNYSGHLR